MGLTIPRAYRLKKASDFWAISADIQKIGTLKVKKALEDFFFSLMDAVDTKSDAYRKRVEAGESDRDARANLVHDTMRNGYKASVVSSMRDPFDFNVSVTFRKWKSRVYLFPRCDMMLRDTLDFLSEDPRLEDFWYDNRGDKPEEISAVEWRRRAKVWDNFAYAPEWDQYVYTELCSWDKWYQLDPFMNLLLTGRLKDWGKPPPSSMEQLVKAAAPKS